MLSVRDLFELTQVIWDNEKYELNQVSLLKN
jgi:hypothetical protein